VSLDDELDRLYQVPPGAFVGERNTLAKALRAAGDKVGAEQVARLARPTPVAWSVNQLHFRAHALLDALRVAGAALRRAQEEQFEPARFAEHRRAHQEALRAATARALSLAEEGGISSNAAFERRLGATLNLLGASTDVSPPPGRMSAELEPMGFDALTSAAPAPPSRSKRPAPAADHEHAERVAGVRAALDAVTREVRRLEQEAQASEARHTRAVRESEDAAHRASLAESAREEARKGADTAQQRLDAARTELTEARRVYEELSARPTH
jgi:hypothetical protein